MYEEYNQQFTTPDGINLLVTIRAGTVDFNVINSVVFHDEYGFRGYNFKDGDTIFDIGSHIGGEALLLSAIRPKMRILCFEPIHENVVLSRKNLIQNNFKDPKVFECAVSDHVGKERIFYAEQNTPAGCENYFVGCAYGFGKGRAIDVDAVTLEKIFKDNNIEKCKMVKMDCEGAEYEILKAAPPEILEKIDWIIGEHHLVPRAEMLKATKGLFRDVPCPYQSDGNLGHFRFARIIK